MKEKEVFALAARFGLIVGGLIGTLGLIVNLVIGSLFWYHMRKVYDAPVSQNVSAELKGEFGDKANKIEVR